MFGLIILLLGLILSACPNGDRRDTIYDLDKRVAAEVVECTQPPPLCPRDTTLQIIANVQGLRQPYLVELKTIKNLENASITRTMIITPKQ
jgi:hypothetical protein